MVSAILCISSFLVFIKENIDYKMAQRNFEKKLLTGFSLWICNIADCNSEIIKCVFYFDVMWNTMFLYISTLSSLINDALRLSIFGKNSRPFRIIKDPSFIHFWKKQWKLTLILAKLCSLKITYPQISMVLTIFLHIMDSLLIMIWWCSFPDFHQIFRFFHLMDCLLLT